MDTESTNEARGTQSARTARRLALVAVALACAAAISLGYILRERERVSLLSADKQQLSATLTQMQGQIDALTSKLNDLNAQRVAQPAIAGQPGAAPQGLQPRREHLAANQASRSRRRAEEARWRKVQAQISDQQRELASTREDLQKTRADLETNLKSSHEELSGSIARNHEELVALEKRGERNYFEFDLSTGKEFKRLGPVSLSLRKTNTKHRHYNVEVLVGDNRISKKDLSLYEPALFYPEGSHRPLELVVNRIGKNNVHGYVSAPKYGESETASSALGSNAAASNGTGNNLQGDQTGIQSAKAVELSSSSEKQSLPHRPNSSQP